MTKNLTLEADSILDKKLSCEINNLSKSPTLSLDDVKTGFLLQDVAQNLCQKNADALDINFTLVYTASIYPTLILKENAKAKQGGSWVPFKN